jgi:glycosyltransferase involved in cell wall biosynthesis
VSFHYGDAIGNEALNLRHLLRRAGYASEIFAERSDEERRRESRPVDEYQGTADDICLFHLGVGERAARVVLESPARLVLMYHNITPPEFFLGFSPELASLGDAGHRLLRALSKRTELALAKSEFSRADLVQIGYRETAVLPILMDFARLEEPPSHVVQRLFGDGRANLLFVGRVVPNKRIEDLIQVLAAYVRTTDPGARLIVVGGAAGQEAYGRRLSELASSLGVADSVVFTGRVSDSELFAYYAVADAFLCLSRHEGFCVPLIEAMYFGVPILAQDAGAVAETLGGAGVLLHDTPPEVTAELIADVLRDSPLGNPHGAADGRSVLRTALLAGQRRRLDEIRGTDSAALLLERLAPLLEKATTA